MRQLPTVHGRGIWTTHGTIDQLACQRVDAPEVAEVGLDTKEVYALDRSLPSVLGALFFCLCSLLGSIRGVVGLLSKVCSESGNRESCLHGRSCAEDENQMTLRRRGRCRNELIDHASSDRISEATGRLSATHSA